MVADYWIVVVALPGIPETTAKFRNGVSAYRYLQTLGDCKPYALVLPIGGKTW
jgi:hypothetical protein